LISAAPTASLARYYQLVTLYNSFADPIGKNEKLASNVSLQDKIKNIKSDLRRIEDCIYQMLAFDLNWIQQKYVVRGSIPIPYRIPLSLRDSLKEFKIITDSKPVDMTTFSDENVNKFEFEIRKKFNDIYQPTEKSIHDFEHLIQSD
jgi:hypothetical protein